MIWRFEDPWLLFLLCSLPFLLFLKVKKVKTGAILFSFIGQLKAVTSKRNLLSKYLQVTLRLLAISFLILAAARPQRGVENSEITTEGVDIMIAIDTSPSMQALDFFVENERVERLTVVKNAVTDFIKKRGHDRIGMVVFGEEAFTQSPLTYDHEVLLNFLDNMTVGMAGDATAIGSALGLAVKRLKDLESKSKIIILFTDGRNNIGVLLPEKAAEIAKKYGIKTYTIGVGTNGKAPFIMNTVIGKRTYYQKVDIDENTLIKIANITDGKYFRATNTESFKDIYAQIDKMEKTELKVKGYVVYNELFYFFAIPGLFCLLLEIILTNTKLRKIP